jgi:hypothetical protein
MNVQDAVITLSNLDPTSLDDGEVKQAAITLLVEAEGPRILEALALLVKQLADYRADRTVLKARRVQDMASVVVEQWK